MAVHLRGSSGAALLLAAAASLALTVVLVGGGGAAAQDGGLVTIGGEDRIGATVETAAAEISGRTSARVGDGGPAEVAAAVAEAFGTDLDVVYVATLEVFADALAVGPLAARDAVPILLVERDALPRATSDALGALSPSRVVVLGGPGAVADTVMADLLVASGAPVERLAGANRWATAAAVAAAGWPDGADTVYLATGEDFPDAMTGGVGAAAADAPVLLLRRGEVPDETRAALDALSPDELVVLGGTAVVSEGVVAALAEWGAVRRLAGPNRFATAVEVARDTFGDAPATMHLATGETFTDALVTVPAAAGGVLDGAAFSQGAGAGGPILLAEQDRLPGETSDYLGGGLGTAEEGDGSGSDSPGTGGGPGGASGPPPNQPPTAGDDAVTTDEDTPLGGDVLADNGGGGDADPDGGTLTVTAVNGDPANVDTSSPLPSGASIRVDADGSFFYDPASAHQALGAGATAIDTFTYTIDDGQGGTDDATVTITITGINDIPDARGDAFATDEDTPVSGNVLADNGNGADSDPEGATLTIAEVNGSAADVGAPVTLGSGASVTVNGDGTFTYDPAGQFEPLRPGFFDSDTFTYTIQDPDGAFDPATATITIGGINDTPVARADAFTTDEDTPVSGNVLADNGNGADSDPEATTLTIAEVNASAADVGAPVTLGSGASVTVNGDGTFTYDPSTSATLNQLPDGGSGADTFTYTISDADGSTDDATVTIDISGINDTPDAVHDDETTDADLGFGEDDGTRAITADVLGNDTDPDTGTTLEITAIDTTASTGLVTLAGGILSYNPNGQFEALGTGQTATDTFTYTISDGDGGGDTATVSITITGVNDAPTAQADAFSTDEDTATGGNLLADNGSGADSDIESQALTVAQVNGIAGDVDNTITLPSGATLTVNGDGTFSYDPSTSATFNALPAAGSATDTFTYRIEDTQGRGDDATVTIDIAGVDDPTTAVDDSFTLAEDSSPTTLSVLANDPDPDGGTTTISGVTQPPAGHVVVTGGGTDLTYEPDPNACNDGTPTDDFTYTLSPGGSTGTVRVTVTCVNDPPVADDETFSVAGNIEHVVETAAGQSAAATGTVFRTLSGNVLAGDGDPVEGTAVSIVRAGGATSDTTAPFDITTTQGGTARLHDDGSFTYTPQTGDRGVADTFTYTIEDGDGGQDTATVTLNVGSDLIWFVDNSHNGGADDTGSGTSSDPFTSLVDEVGTDTDPDDAEDAAQAGDTIYVFQGNSRTTDPYTGGIELKDDQRLLGEGVNLVSDLGSGPETLVTGTAAARPRLTATRLSNVLLDEVGGEVAGVSLTTDDGSGIRATMASADVTIRDLDSTSTTTGQGIGVTTPGDGTALGSVSIDRVQTAGAGTALSLDRDAAFDPDLIVTSLCQVTVLGSTTWSGIFASGVTFDADPDTAGAQPVMCQTTTVGTSADPVGRTGIDLNDVKGDLDLGEVSVHAGNRGIAARSRGASDFTLSATTGPVTAGQAAIDLEQLTLDATFSSLTAGSGGDEGIALDNVAGTLTVAGATSIASPSVNGIDITNTSADVAFGPVTIQDGATAGVAITGSSGSFTFDSLDIDDGTTGVWLASNIGTTTFNSPTTIDVTSGWGLITNGSRVDVLGSSNTITTTTGQPLALKNTSSTVTFDSVSTTGVGSYGIEITNILGDVTVNGGTIANRSSRGIDISGGSSTVTIGADVTAATGHSVEVTNRTGGTVHISGHVDDDGAGIRLDNNGGGTVRFTGAIDVDTFGSSTGFSATGGGTVEVAGSSTRSVNTSAGTGTAVVIDGTTIGADGVTFTSVFSDGASNGIVLNSTGAGSFKVTGAGSTGVVGGNGSGGTIANTTGSGVRLTNVTGVSLRNMHVTSAGSHGIEGTTVTNLDLTGVTILNAGDAVNEHGINLINLQGTAAANTDSAFDYVRVTGSADNGVQVANSTSTNPGASGNPDLLTISNADISSSGLSGVLAVTDTVGTANLKVVVTDSTLHANSATGVLTNADGGELSVHVDGSDIGPGTGNTFRALAGATTGGDLTVLVTDNTLEANNGTAGTGPFTIAYANHGSGQLVGRIGGSPADANTISNSTPGVGAGGTAVGAISLVNQGSGTSTVEVRRNTMSLVDGFGVIADVQGSGGGSGHWSVIDNTITVSGTDNVNTPVSALNSSTVPALQCLNMSGNTMSNGAAGNVDTVISNNLASSTYQVQQTSVTTPGGGDLTADNQDVEIDLTNAQTVPGGGTQINPFSSNGPFTPGTCLTPLIP